MIQLNRRGFVAATLGVACGCAAAAPAFAQAAGAKYVCPPCGCSQDGKEFDKPGVCPDAACGMVLIPKPEGAPPAPKPPQGAAL
jgi:hypothetical protein